MVMSCNLDIEARERLPSIWAKRTVFDSEPIYLFAFSGPGSQFSDDVVAWPSDSQTIRSE